MFVIFLLSESSQTNFFKLMGIRFYDATKRGLISYINEQEPCKLLSSHKKVSNLKILILEFYQNKISIFQMYISQQYKIGKNGLGMRDKALHLDLQGVRFKFHQALNQANGPKLGPEAPSEVRMEISNSDLDRVTELYSQSTLNHIKQALFNQ